MVSIASNIDVLNHWQVKLKVVAMAKKEINASRNSTDSYILVFFMAT